MNNTILKERILGKQTIYKDSINLSYKYKGTVS